MICCIFIQFKILLISFVISSLLKSLFKGVLFSKYLRIFQIFLLLIPKNSALIREYSPYDFNPSKFIEICFIMQHIDHFGKCSVCTWKECVVCCYSVSCFINVSVKVKLGEVFYELTNFLSASINKKVLNFPTKIGHLSISACSSINFYVTHIETLIRCINIGDFYILLMNLPPYYYEMILFIKKCFHNLGGSWNQGLE